jgi:phosphatidylinositol-bisphosphatase
VGFFSSDEPDVSDDWSPGECRYYGKADLRQSDHRPVICILDIQAQVVDEESRREVFNDTIAKLGPPDGTIVITVQNNALLVSMMSRLNDGF